MRLDRQPRPQTPLFAHNEAATFLSNGQEALCNAISPASARSFSATHLPACQAPVMSQAETGQTIHIGPCQGMSIFDRQVFSKPFEQLYRAALQAINSGENQEHYAKTGRYSPSANIAIDKFMAIVETKSATNTTAAVRAFLEGPLTLIEVEAWLAFVSQLPPSCRSQPAAASTWKPVVAGELHTVLSSEPAFALFLQKPEGTKFVADLMHAINRKTAEMLPTDRGMACVFRFDCMYGSVAHTAVGSFWRDSNGKLCMGIAHQESVPASQASGGVWTGVVYNTFDTSRDYPGGRAPAIESIRFAGFPSVNVFPCPRPEAIEPEVARLAGADNTHPYGATDNWNEKKRGTLPAERPFETCFDVTRKVLAKLYDIEVPQAPTLPTTLWEMRPFTSMSPTDFSTVSIPNGKNAKSIDLINIANEPADDIRKAFAVIGEKWGLSRAWDVCSSLRSSKHSIVMTPGKEGIDLPMGVRNIKFITNPPKLSLEGQPVLAGQTYSSDEASKMHYQGKEKSRPILIVAAFDDRAKL